MKLNVFILILLFIMFNDFIECRKFSLLIEFFTLSTFFLFRKLCKELNVPFFDFIWLIFQKLEKQKSEVPSNFLNTYNEFAKECQEELFESKEKIYELSLPFPRGQRVKF